MIKSQDELNTCNDGNRGSEVLLATIEKCEKLEKENNKLKKKLEIAISALEEYANQKWWDDCITLDNKDKIHPKCAWSIHGYISAQQALAEIKETK